MSASPDSATIAFHHFANLLGRCWRVFTESLGTTTLGFFTQPLVSLLIASITLYIIFRKRGATAVKTQITESVTTTLVVGLVALFIVYGAIFVKAVIQTIYDDHASLVSRVSTLKAEIVTKETEITELQGKLRESPKVVYRNRTATENSVGPDPKLIGGIAGLADRGAKIQADFIKTNDVETLKKKRLEWATDAITFLNAQVDPSYAIQFNNAHGSAMMGCPVNRSADGCGYWQDIQGKKEALMSALTEMRQRR